MNSSDHGAFCFARCLILNSIALIGICLFRLSVSSCALLGLYCCVGFSLVAAGGSYSIAAVQASRCGGLSCSVACGISVPQSEIKSASLALQGGFLTTGLPGKSPYLLLDG